MYPPAGIPADDCRRRRAPHKRPLDANGVLTQGTFPPTSSVPRTFAAINLGQPGPKVGVDCAEEEFLGAVSGPVTGTLSALARRTREIRRKIPHVSGNLFGQAHLSVDFG